jgi:radical SAM superfamily enzyme YgiQ (UPF0313 family)
VVSGPFDAICIGEGEWPTVSLAEESSAKRTPAGIANHLLFRKSMQLPVLREFRARFGRST